ncbi:hypothetical protein V9T40_001757 [Parthenolecanium corni]|uniref:Uncharacterized protein n=1 Tax=Parthenolecanium corni TaxID=536013 RepID=A0AAN9TJ30_9HEMI
MEGVCWRENLGPVCLGYRNYSRERGAWSAIMAASFDCYGSPFYEENEIIRGEMTKDHAASSYCNIEALSLSGADNRFEANNFLRFPVNGKYVGEGKRQV